jgi:hypothetical protein
VTTSRLTIDSPATRYVRGARKLRARLGNRPGQLHRALQELSPPVVEAVLEEKSPAEELAQCVIAELEGGLLRYSARLRLLKQSDAMGIERFEANLIIAAVQSRYPRVTPASANRSIGAMAIAAIVALIQATIIAAAWWIVVG